MNRQELDILNALNGAGFVNQRDLAERCGHSLGIVNRCVKSLHEKGYLDADRQLTERARVMLEACVPQSAVILAAGFGMRMVPINLESPKALLDVSGERLIERQIRQLQEAGVRHICVVVGFLKEQFEYLMDEYGVELIVNSEYSERNNLYSLKLALDYLARTGCLGNTYIVPSDIWCRKNPFRRSEPYSWYMVCNCPDEESDLRLNRRLELVQAKGRAGNRLTGISYLSAEDMEIVRARVNKLSKERTHDGDFWEAVLYEQDKFRIPARLTEPSDVVEINTYEQLRDLDGASQHLKSEAIAVIAREFQVRETDIVDISVLKKGMTNRSFLFSCGGKRYIMRIPGEGTDQLIDRSREAEVYCAISGRGICDDPVYINPESGYKITEYLDGVRCCDPENEDDLKKCMAKLKHFHEMKLTVGHEFDLFAELEFYERLRGGRPSVYRDYGETKRGVMELRDYIDRHAGEKVLTHIDAVPDNFLFCQRNGQEELQLTDWEYAGMQDPHVDIAMFCIYSLYDRKQVDRLISIYFDGQCPPDTRRKIYCYIAVCGLLWSNWCEYKSSLGVEFGEYGLRQYRYAKDYYRLVMREPEQERTEKKEDWQKP